MKKPIVLVLAFLLICSVSLAADKKEVVETITYNTSEGMPDLNKLKLRETPSGLKLVDVVRGEDMMQPGLGQTVVVHYTGWLLDGRKFDSSHDRNETFEFRIGGNRVIKGWDEGVSLMELGAKRILVIPGKLAYGKGGSLSSTPPIPANATLVFEIELIEIK